jgi:hypothetical protein
MIQGNIVLENLLYEKQQQKARERRQIRDCTECDFSDRSMFWVTAKQEISSYPSAGRRGLYAKLDKQGPQPTIMYLGFLKNYKRVKHQLRHSASISVLHWN